MNSILNVEYSCGMCLAVFIRQGNLVVEMRAGHSDPYKNWASQTGLGYCLNDNIL